MEYMNPTETVSILRRIATAIENSEKPQIDHVIRDLKKVIAGVAQECGPEGAPPGAPPMGGPPAVGQQQQQAIPKSDSGKSMLKKMLSDAEHALDKGDDAGFKSALEKALKHNV